MPKLCVAIVVVASSLQAGCGSGTILATETFPEVMQSEESAKDAMPPEIVSEPCPDDSELYELLSTELLVVKFTSGMPGALVDSFTTRWGLIEVVHYQVTRRYVMRIDRSAARVSGMNCITAFHFA